MTWNLLQTHSTREETEQKELELCGNDCETDQGLITRWKDNLSHILMKGHRLSWQEVTKTHFILALRNTSQSSCLKRSISSLKLLTVYL